MNGKECDARAAACMAQAAIAPTEALVAEFLKLASQWRAISVRTILFQPFDSLIEPEAILLPSPAGVPTLSN